MKRLFSFFIALSLLSPLVSGAFLHPVSAAEQAALPQTEIEARSLALNKIFELSLKEIADLRIKVETLNEAELDPVLRVMQETFVAHLKEHVDMIKSRLHELDSDYTTLEGIKTMAENFKRWRMTVYDPETKEIFDLLLFTQAQTILTTAKSRIAKVAADVEKITLLPEKQALLEQYFTDAQTLIKQAQGLQDTARQMMVSTFLLRHREVRDAVVKAQKAMEAPAELASVVDAVQPAKDEDDKVVETEKLVTVQDYVKRSVVLIGDAYKVFLKMRELVKAK